MLDESLEFPGASPSAPAPRPFVGRLRCIAVGSGKGGVGKTVVSVGVGCCLARRGYRVLILDADLGLANVDLHMGLDPMFTMQDVIFGNRALEDVVLSVVGGPDVLPAATASRELVELGDARRRMFVEELIHFAENYDFLIIDVAAGIGNEVTTFLSAVPEVIAVATNEPTSIMGAYSLVKVLLQGANPPDIMLVINMVKSLAEGRALGIRLNKIASKFLVDELPLAGSVVHDAVVQDAIRARTPLMTYAGNSGPAQCLNGIASFLVRRESELRKGARPQQHVFDGLARLGTSTRASA